MPENATQSTPSAPATFAAWAAEQWHGAPVWYRAAMGAVVLGGTALAVARAFTTGITFDEAYNWHLYLQHDFGRIWGLYDANNHLLNTVLSRLCVELFGPAEWAMRLPALFGRLGFLLAVALLSALLLRGWALRLGAIVLVATQPVLLDFGSLSRGYSLALCFAAWGLAAGLWKVERDSARPGPRPLREDVPLLAGMSVLFGLSVMTVPVFINFVAPFCLLLAAREFWLWGRPRQERGVDGPPWRRGVYTVALLAGPAAVLNLAVWGPVLPNIKPGVFYLGMPSAWGGYQTLHWAMLYAGDVNVTPLPDAPFRWLTALTLQTWVQVAGATVLVASLVWGAVQGRNVPLRWTALALVLAFCMAASQNLLLGLPWPLDRTMLYVVPLLLLIIPAGLQAAGRLDMTAVRAAGWVLLLLFAVYQVSKLTMEWHFSFRTSGPVREVMREFQEMDGPVRFVHTEWVQWEIEYYRDRHGLEHVTFLRDDTVEDLATARLDLALLFSHDVPDEPGWVEEAVFPAANLVLLRRESPAP